MTSTTHKLATVDFDRIADIRDAIVREVFRPSSPVSEVRKSGIRALSSGGTASEMFLRGRGGRKQLIDVHPYGLAWLEEKLRRIWNLQL